MRSSQRSLAAFLAMSIVSNGPGPELLSANDVSARRFTSNRFLLCFVWLVTLLFTGQLAAQVAAQYTPTNTPNKKTGVDSSSIGSPTESVNLSTGNVHIEQPLLSLPRVNGLDLNLSAYWDSKRYDIETYSNPFMGSQACGGGALSYQMALAVRDSVAGEFAGGSLSIPRLFYTSGGFVGALFYGSSPGGCDSPMGAVFGNNQWVYLDEHGGKHPFNVRRDYNLYNPALGYSINNYIDIDPVLIDDTTDGSLIRLDTTGYPIVTVHLPDGKKVRGCPR